ncbi:hypothetical protein CMO90_03385 [Candidatus Woesearchaeota archaeon]|jgi:hypothetical protein|nr:hypothetical protein [Candidatus Woesearchaeota archaeon]|tara:strand:+ start:846 stop:1082 length:237 start_codon:yes stop_codon:yes gene_type:complete
MLIENLEEKINDLEYKLENSDKQSIYFKWGMKNHGRILDNYKKQFEIIKNDFDNMSVAELENELTEKKKKCNSLKVRS